MYAVFFKSGEPVTRIKEERRGLRFDTIVWEPEVYKTREEAEARAKELNAVTYKVYSGNECIGEVKTEVVVKEV